MILIGPKVNIPEIKEDTVLANILAYDLYLQKVTLDHNNGLRCMTFYVVDKQTNDFYFMNVKDSDNISRLLKLNITDVLNIRLEKVSDNTYKINRTTNKIIDTILKNRLIHWLRDISIIKDYEYTKGNYEISEYNNNISLVFKLDADKDSDELRYLIKDALIRDLALHEKIYEVNCNNSLNKNTEHVMNINIVI